MSLDTIAMTGASVLLAALLLGFIGVRMTADYLDRRHCHALVRGIFVRLLRELENNPRNMPARLKESRLATLAAIKEWDTGPISVPFSPTPIGSQPPVPPDRLLQARDIAEWNERSASEFWKKAQALRDECIVLLALFRHHNPLAAAQSITERMPDDHLRELLAQPMTWRRHRSLRAIIQTHDAFVGLEYAPFDEDKVYHEREILDGLRNYAR